MAYLLTKNPIKIFMFNLIAIIYIFYFSLFIVCEAGSPIETETFELKKGFKYSYYNTEDDALDLPTLDAYDFGPPSLAQPPLGLENQFLSPSPLVNPPISSPPKSTSSPSPGPNPYGTSWTLDPPSPPPSPSPSPSPYGASRISNQPDPIAVKPHNGPTQPIYPPPSMQPIGAPTHGSVPNYAMWCVAKPMVPEPVLQRAMDYACGTGADCGPVQTNGPCFVPNNLVAHSSYAFNSYWQRTKILGGTCDFGGVAMLITVDPSFRGCYFTYN